MTSNAAKRDGIAACQRRTTGGKICSFPFTYNGLIHNDCVAWSESMNMYWCPTKGDMYQTINHAKTLAGNARAGGDLSDDSWGWCDKGCWSGPTGTPSIAPTGVPSSTSKPTDSPVPPAPLAKKPVDKKPRSADCARQTVQGKICQLPMLYKGKKHNDCIRYSEEVEMYWCITAQPTITNKTAPASFEWGWCMEGCAPDPTALSTIKLPAQHTHPSLPVKPASAQSAKK
jgi:hypothetical protein